MKRIVTMLLIAGMVMTASAVPARRDAIVRTLADGTQKTVFLHGDAFSHYMTDEAGNWLDEETLLPMSPEMKAQRMQLNEERRQARRVQQARKIGNKPNIAPRGLVILVNFTDNKFSTSYETLHDMLDGENFSRNYEYKYKYQGETYDIKVQSSGSARKYFHDQSYGQYNPIFDLVGPYTLSHELSYYGKNNDYNVGKMIKEACELADADGADFTLYDNDNDGKVDFVYVIYAGYGEADGGPTETVWPHNSSLDYFWGVSCTVDGKKVANYACSNELNYFSNQYNGIGTFCHEFSHVLGLPDLYETNQNPKGLHTLLDWDVLDYGPYNNDGNTPPAYSAYERFFCGWLTPYVLSDPEYVWLNPLNFKNGYAMLMCEGDQHNLVGYDPEPKVFYLLEVRTKEGWDKHLPGKGLLITKISYDANDWEYNTVNNSATKMGVDLIEAKQNNSYYGKLADAFPYGAKFWTGFEDHEMTEIAIQQGGSVTFSYRYAPQGIEEVGIQPSAISTQKVIRDGRMYIQRGDKIYDVMGNVQ